MNSSRFSFAWFLRPRLLLLVAVAALALLAYALTSVFQAGANPATSLSVSPPSQTVSVGDTFQTAISVTTNDNLQGADITINYDPTKLSAQSLNVGTTLPTAFASACNNTTGTCTFIGVRVAPAPPFNGTGNLFTITWQALAATASTTIDIDGGASELSDNNGALIGYSHSDGTVTITTAPTTGSITAHKFRDDNQNQVQNAGEPDLSGWTMTLYSGFNCIGAVLDSGTTDVNGDEVFANLAAGNYSVRETTQSGWSNTTADCQNESLSTGEDAILNFGNVPSTGSITAHKFRDDDQDEVQDAGEPDLSGWTMALYSGSNCTGSVLSSGATNVNGNRVFANLSAGTYSVRETLQSGWSSTTDLCQSETLSVGENATLNFGNVQLAANLVLTKSSSLSSVAAGGTVTFTLTSSNTGSGTASSYFIEDIITAGLTITAATPSEGDCDQIAPVADESPPWTGPATIRCGPFTTPAGGSDTVSLTATVTASAGTVLNGALTDSDDAVAESNEDANDPDLSCISVGEGTDAGAATEPDNYDCVQITVTPGNLWGDMDCDNDVDAVDAMWILTYIVGLPVNQMEPCPDIGDSIVIVTP